MNFDSMIAPPEEEPPVREYSQKSETSGIPDNLLVESFISPIGETLAQHCHRLSKRARDAWLTWATPSDEIFVDTSGEIVPTLGKPVELAMFDEYEYLEYVRNKRILTVEEGRFKKDLHRIHTRAVQESAFRHKVSDTISEIPNSIRYKKRIVKKEDEFGGYTYEEVVTDLCDGKATIQLISHTSVSDNMPTMGSPSYQERALMAHLSDCETSKWRHAHRAEEDNKFLPATTPVDDPDYLPPLSLSKRNFTIYPPAARPYNCVFNVVLANGTVKKLYPKLAKDYTSLSSIVYTLKLRKIPFRSVTIDQINGKPNCKFEIDLRVTYGEDLTPSATSYKKVDTTSVLGAKLIQLLNEQPYLFKEHYVSVEEEGETHRMLIVYYEVTDEKFGPRVYWFYVDKKQNPIGTPKYFKKKILFPTIDYFYAQNFRRSIEYKMLPEVANYLKKNVLIGAKIRLSKSYYQVKLVEFAPQQFKKVYTNHPEIEDNLVKAMKEKGLELVSIQQENYYNDMYVYTFILPELKTRTNRNTFFQQLLASRNDSERQDQEDRRAGAGIPQSE